MAFGHRRSYRRGHVTDSAHSETCVIKIQYYNDIPDDTSNTSSFPDTVASGSINPISIKRTPES
ncbi:hypothetical protein K439DRAFT_1638965 [Ramaria rubella]|nr:hypothetical protein K439DRAFT_1643219 [Ramaria rubella]KAF8578285.1 hypothetical protein K439DRAFT_1638965 [Ramaria rubella]